jgi:hypothetical protein
MKIFICERIIVYGKYFKTYKNKELAMSRAYRLAMLYAKRNGCELVIG